MSILLGRKTKYYTNTARCIAVVLHTRDTDVDNSDGNNIKCSMEMIKIRNIIGIIYVYGHVENIEIH